MCGAGWRCGRPQNPSPKPGSRGVAWKSLGRGGGLGWVPGCALGCFRKADSASSVGQGAPPIGQISAMRLRVLARHADGPVSGGRVSEAVDCLKGEHRTGACGNFI